MTSRNSSMFQPLQQLSLKTFFPNIMLLMLKLTSNNDHLSCHSYSLKVLRSKLIFIIKIEIVYNRKDKSEAIWILGEVRQNLHSAEWIFDERLSLRPVYRKFLKQLINKFNNTGNIKRTERPSYLQDKQIDIMSTSQVIAVCDLSSRTIQSVLKKTNSI